jgi:hypothetical protein
VHTYIDRSDLERAVVAAGRQTPAMLPGEHAGRIWLSLAGIDPGGVPASTSEQDDAAALARADEVLDSLTDQGVALVRADLLPRVLKPYRHETALTAIRRALTGQ